MAEPPRGIALTVTDRPGRADLERLQRGLDATTPDGCGPFAFEPLAVLAHAGRNLVGGAYGDALWGWFGLRMLWVAPEWRGRSLGRALVERIEAAARERGCRYSRLDTFSFQAPGFYRRLGYRPWGELADFPRGHRRHFLLKALVRERLPSGAEVDDAAYQIACVPVIETERLRLRRFEPADFEPYARMALDPEVRRFLPSVGNPADAWRQFALLVGHWQLRGFGFWAAEEKASGRLIGRIGCHEPEGWPGLEIGWALDPAVWGRGLATEGGRAALEFAHHRLGRRGIISLIRPDNAASIRVAQKLGGVPDGMVEIGGTPCRIYRYADPDRPARDGGAPPGPAR